MRTLILLAAILAVSTNGHAQSRWSWPEEAQNLQVLPKDTAGNELGQIMRGFTRSLGVRCSHCHVGEEGQPLSSYDFASDARPNKDVAREMMRMVTDIRGHLAKAAPVGAEPANADCYTCHRGIAQPVRLEVELSDTWMDYGAAAAIDRYHEMRERYYGSGSYDFGAGTLDALGHAMLDGDDVEGAITAFALNTELFPESSNAWDSLAGAHRKAGHTEQAIAFYEKSLELEPRNRGAAQALEELRGN